jgi:hypothetical protein
LPFCYQRLTLVFLFQIGSHWTGRTGTASNEADFTEFVIRREGDQQFYAVTLQRRSGDDAAVREAKPFDLLENPDARKVTIRVPRSCIMRVCAVDDCDADAAQKCSQCRNVYYCSRECQKTAWKAHKTMCNS